MSTLFFGENKIHLQKELKVHAHTVLTIIHYTQPRYGWLQYCNFRFVVQ